MFIFFDILKLIIYFNNTFQPIWKLLFSNCCSQKEEIDGIQHTDFWILCC